MKEEIEIRVVVTDYDQIKNILKEKAIFQGEKAQKDEYFAPQGDDFYSYKPRYLRVRHQENKNTVTYGYCHVKGTELIKIDEFETKVDDPVVMTDILNNLGFIAQATITKQRTSFTFKNYDIELDRIVELGSFLEVEIKDHKLSYEEAKQSCYNILEELGIDWSEKADHTGYIDMIIEKNT